MTIYKSFQGGLMEIHLNGKKTESKAGTIMDLVLEQGLDPCSLIAEINFKLIPQESWKAVPVRPGDIIELLSFVGGG
jgi:sulfur carrier protein